MRKINVEFQKNNVSKNMYFALGTIALPRIIAIGRLTLC